MGVNDSEYVELFLAEARENLETLNTAVVKVEADPADRDTLDAIFRVAHSVKGMAATMGYDDVAALTHNMEDVFSLLRERSGGLPREAIDVLFDCLDMLSKMVNEIEAGGASKADPAGLIHALQGLIRRRDKEDEAAEEAPAAVAEVGPDLVNAAVKDAQSRATVRVEASRLDTLLHMIGELVVRRSSVEQLAIEAGDTQLQSAVGELTRASQAVQDMVMRVRMVPIDTAFARLPRLVRDLSHQLGKEVDLQLEGRDTELDRTAVDALVEPLMHLVRNAIDHGIEAPDVRKGLDKPEMGILRIAARHEGGEVVIGITDDGAGIDTARVIEQARERGLVNDAEKIDDDQAIELLFMPGFSTATEVSDISGRGVGMDAVRAAVRGFGGDVRVRSEKGVGTTTELRMPLTLAILPALVVRSGGDPYALQLDRVDRTFRSEEVTVTTTAGQPVAVFDDTAMPVVSLAEMFDREPSNTAENGVENGVSQFMVTVRSADRQIALTVDEMVGRRELVTRPVPERVRQDAPVSGGAVLASGEIAFIVDCEELIRRTLIEPVAKTGTG
ncbi:MAG: chemotaxis protein CheA [Solirubrobacterales bacterium]